MKKAQDTRDLILPSKKDKKATKEGKGVNIPLDIREAVIYIIAKQSHDFQDLTGFQIDQRMEDRVVGLDETVRDQVARVKSSIRNLMRTRARIRDL